jgi:hypothetical protein
MFSLWTKIKAGAIALAGVIIAIGLVFLKGRKAGIDHIEAEQSARRVQSMKDRKAVDDDVQNLGSNDVDQSFDRWLRDDKR